MLIDKRRTTFLVAIPLLAIASAVSWAFVQRGDDPVAVEKLLPERSIIYAKAHGSLTTDAEFKKTAAYKALYESGLMQAIEDGFNSLPNDFPASDQLEEALTHLQQHGLSFSITDGGMMQPWCGTDCRSRRSGRSETAQRIARLPATF